MQGTNSQTYFRRTVDGAVDGPHLGDALKRMALAGTLRPDELISKSEDGPWTPAHRVRGLSFAPQPTAPREPTAVTDADNAGFSPPQVVRCPVEEALEQLLQSEGKAIPPKLSLGQSSGIPVLDMIEAASAAIEVIDAGSQVLRGLPRRLHEDFFLCGQVERAQAEKAVKDYGDKFPKGERVLAVLRTAMQQTAYITSGHLLLQTTSEDGSLTSTLTGLMTLRPARLSFDVIPLRDILEFRFEKAGGRFSTESPQVLVNGTCLGHLQLPPATARLFERVVAVAAAASRASVRTT